MGLIKKIDVDRYLAERRATRLGRTGPLIEAVPVACDSDGTNVSQSRQA